VRNTQSSPGVVVEQDHLDVLLQRLRRQGTDDGSVEAKASGTSLSKDVWDSVSAFANTRGGTLVLGLAERDGFAVVPDFDLDRVRDQFIDGMGDGNVLGTRLTNPPTYRVFRLAVDDRPVLAIEIDENSPGHKPCYVSAKGLVGGAYKRIDDKDVKLSATEIFELQHTFSDHAADREKVEEATLEDLDPELVNAFLAVKATGKALRGTRTRSERLNRLNVVDKSGALRLAGLLTLGTYPQQFFPRLLVDVTAHPANEKSSPGEQLRFLDRTECEGPLVEVVDDAVNAVARNLRTRSTVTGRGRTDELELPHDVLREAIANAVVHREYHGMFRGQPVTVDVFPNRVVVTSPGGLWGGKTLETLDDGASRCRNQTLLQMLQDVPLSGSGTKAAEGQGGGIRLMINRMAERGLEPPSFRASPDTVVVELRREQIGAGPRRETSPAGDLTSTSGGARRLSSTAREVLAALSTDEPHDIHALSAATDRSPNSLRPVLRRLVEAGLVVATAPPSSRERSYLRAPGT
jgi:ATP-dependent DNA helicase RecG